MAARHLFILAQFCSQKMRIRQTNIILPPIAFWFLCERAQCSNVWVSNSRKQRLFWKPASVETFKTARHSCTVRCMSSSSSPGVPAVPLQGGEYPHEQVVSKMLKVLLPARRISLSRCWFCIRALLWLLRAQLPTTAPTSTSSLASIPGQTRTILALPPTLAPAPQSSWKVSLVTLGSTTGRSHVQLTFRTGSSRGVPRGTSPGLILFLLFTNMKVGVWMSEWKLARS